MAGSKPIRANEVAIATMTRDVVLKFNFNAAKLMRAINTPDDVGAIIRLHNELDAAFKHVITALVPAPVPPLQYMSERIACLLAMGLPRLRVAPALIINSIRNNFAHNDKEEFKARDVSKLHKAVTTLYDREIPPSFVLIHRKKDSDREWRYGDMVLKEKFCFLGFLAVAGIAAIENDFTPATFKRIA